MKIQNLCSVKRPKAVRLLEGPLRALLEHCGGRRTGCLKSSANEGIVADDNCARGLELSKGILVHCNAIASRGIRTLLSELHLIMSETLVALRRARGLASCADPRKGDPTLFAPPDGEILAHLACCRSEMLRMATCSERSHFTSFPTLEFIYIPNFDSNKETYGLDAVSGLNFDSDGILPLPFVEFETLNCCISTAMAVSQLATADFTPRLARMKPAPTAAVAARRFAKAQMFLLAQAISPETIAEAAWRELVKEAKGTVAGLLNINIEDTFKDASQFSRADEFRRRHVENENNGQVEIVEGFGNGTYDGIRFWTGKHAVADVEKLGPCGENGAKGTEMRKKYPLEWLGKMKEGPGDTGWGKTMTPQFGNRFGPDKEKTSRAGLSDIKILESEPPATNFDLKSHLMSKFTTFAKALVSLQNASAGSLAEQFEKLAIEAREDNQLAVANVAARCGLMLHRGSGIREVETLLAQKAEENFHESTGRIYTRMLKLAIPHNQTILLVNEAQLCEDDVLRTTCTELMQFRISVLERPLEMVSLILDEETALLLSQNPTAEWTQTVVRWIVSRGQARFRRFIILLVLPAPPPDELVILLCALCRVNHGISAMLRIAENTKEAAAFVRHFVLHHCNKSHSVLFSNSEDTSDTVHEAVLRQFPDMNGLRAYRMVLQAEQGGSLHQEDASKSEQALRVPSQTAFELYFARSKCNVIRNSNQM